MKTSDVLALLESFPDLFDDEDLLEELAAELEPASNLPPARAADDDFELFETFRDRRAR